MRNRSGVADNENDVAALTLDQLNREIARVKSGYEYGGTSQARKSFFKRLIWLEGLREKLHGIEAPRRRFNS